MIFPIPREHKPAAATVHIAIGGVKYAVRSMLDQVLNVLDTAFVHTVLIEAVHLPGVLKSSIATTHFSIPVTVEISSRNGQ